MTSNDVGNFVDFYGESLKDIINDIKESFENFLEEEKIDKLNENSTRFSDAIEVWGSFSKYKSMSGQIKALKKTHGYVDPETIYLGIRKEEVINEDIAVIGLLLCREMSETSLERANFPSI